MANTCTRNSIKQNRESTEGFSKWKSRKTGRFEKNGLNSKSISRFRKRWTELGVSKSKRSLLVCHIGCKWKSLVIRLKLYCRYEYTKPCMINRIWGLKQLYMNSGEWTCLISFLTAPLTCSERGGSEKIQNANICVQRDSNPHHASQVSALDHSATRAW